MLQAAGGAVAYPLLEQAARDIGVGSPEQPIVIADYGSSQGKNSMAPIQSAIEALRARVGRDQPIMVFHIDQPANDFNTLFGILADRGSYSASDSNVHSCAIGKSFYDCVLPRNFVHIGWSAYAAVWLSRIPMAVPGHFVAVNSTGTVRAAFDRQGKEDWETFLTLRATELRQDGRLIVVLPALEDDGSWGSAGLMDHANAALSEMLEAGEITADQRGRMIVGIHPRRRNDLLAPFSPHGQFEGLVVEHCAISVVPHPAWSSYEKHGDRELLAAELALFFRSTFMPSLATALSTGRGAEGSRGFGDRLEERMKRRLAVDAAPAMNFVATIMLAKRGHAKA